MNPLLGSPEGTRRRPLHLLDARIHRSLGGAPGFFAAFVMTLCFGFVGCSGVEVIPSVSSESDLVVNIAHDYLREMDVVGSTDLCYATAPVQVLMERGAPPPPWSKAWRVSFDLFDAFGEPLGRVTTTVMRYDEVSGTRYVVET